MISRRTFGASLGAAATLALTPSFLHAAKSAKLITRAIPKSGERLPVIGLGTSATFAQLARGEDTAVLRDVIRTMVERGATVLDTAPAYGSAEEVSGALAKSAGVTDKVFWATKVNVAGRGDDAKADADAARAQVEASFKKLNTDKIDLIQVHNVADIPTQLGVLKTLKKEGRVRYIGATTSNDGQYPTLIDAMKNEPLDFIGIDYAIDNRTIEEDILPLAAERRIGVLVYLPFGRTRLFKRVEGKALPEWAAEFDATTWAQFFLKYVISHPAVTVVTPATTKVKHLLDNIGGGIGRLPNAATRKRMAAFVDALPSA